MNKYTTVASVLAMAAMSAPMVCQAQDPATFYSQIVKLSQGGKPADAVELCDKVIAVYGKPSSRVAQQFAHMVPFFYWQKGTILSSMGKYDEACETFKTLYTQESFKKKEMIDRSKAIPGQPQGYEPYLTGAMFQEGYNRFMQASGTADKPGDAAKFEEAIPVLEEYLKLYQAGKVSATEKAQKLDGKICFLLMQANLLKKTPDFKAAEQYLEKSRTAKSPLPDNMAMGGLDTVIRVASANPQYIDWGHKVVSSNPASYDLGSVRLARYGAQFLNQGIKAAGLVDGALRKGDMKTAAAAARTENSLFSLIPDVVETHGALSANVKSLGKYAKPLPDKAAELVLNAKEQKQLVGMYAKFHKTNMQVEAYAIITAANTALQFGSNRLAKAGYQILLDRYPKLSQKGKDGKMVSMKDKNYFQFSQLCRATGDDAKATEYEGKVDGSKMGADGGNTILVNTMARLLKEQKWAEVIPAADAVMKAYSADPAGDRYVTAQFSKVASYYKLRQFDKVVKDGVALLDSGSLVPGKIKEKQVNTYKSQTMFFVLDSYREMAGLDPVNLDKCLEYVSRYIKEFPSMDLKQNPLVANVYYDGVDALLKRRGHGVPEADAKDLAKALEYCNVIADNWKDNDLYPTARLLTGSILINGEDEARNPEGIVALEECAEASLKQGEKGKGTAANALFWLVSYAREMKRDGESDADHKARVQGYADRFWAEADYEGNPYALQMASLDLTRAMESNDKDTYTKALKHAEEIIAREANASFAKNKLNPELEMTLNSYVLAYVDGNKQVLGKELTLEEKAAHFNNFPGISKDDKYTNAILRMALLNSMEEAKKQAKRDGNESLVAQLDRDIAQTFRQMTDSFKPSDLTNFICVQVGNYEVSYADRLPDQASKLEELNTALAYFDMVLSRNTDMINEANLGKANALALMTGDDKKQGEAATLYQQLAGNSNNEVSGPALMGITKLYMATQDYAKAVESASKYVNNRGNRSGRLQMMMMLGEAYAGTGDVAKGLQTYMNLYNQNRGNISYSAPACKAMMELMWKRNTPASGDRMKGTFKQSDHWRAWTTGQDYVTQIRKAGIEEKMTPDERDKFNEVVKLVAQYAADAGVQKEDKEKKEFSAKLGKKK